jgi:broad specificity phosphatase PhoE
MTSEGGSGEIVLVRHGETEWSREGRHTGTTDLPLTDTGRTEALSVAPWVCRREFELVLCSPLRRARETAEVMGYAELLEVDGDLAEWNYGDYEGLTTTEIREHRPGWSVWDQGPEGGETIAEVAARVCRVVDRCETASGDVLLFAHGHSLRILTATYLGLPPSAGRLFALETSGVGVLGYEREWRTLRRWNPLT